METETRHVCAICGLEQTAAPWFLVASNEWQDRLRIIRCKNDLVAGDDFRFLCCPWHVEQLVVHWLATGSMDYPFARSLPTAARMRQESCESRNPENGARLLGELTVDRESLARLLRENPYAFAPMLEALVTMLQKDGASPSSSGEYTNELHLVS